MLLSTRATYGMRLCFMLALSKTPLSASQLVKQTDVSLKYVEQLLRLLRTGNIVESYRGKQGGYVLAREPHNITVRDMLDALDDGFVAPACVGGACDDLYCPNRIVLDKISSGINDVLGGVTLADMINDCRAGCGSDK